MSDRVSPMTPARDRLRARPLHRRPARRQARGRDRAAQPLAPAAGARRAARRDRAQEHHHDRPDRRREDRDRAPPGQAGAGALHQGRGLEVHRGRLRRAATSSRSSATSSELAIEHGARGGEREGAGRGARGRRGAPARPARCRNRRNRRVEPGRPGRQRRRRADTPREAPHACCASGKLDDARGRARGHASSRARWSRS